MGETTYAAKLVDLPAIVESHKTLDNRQLFKIADISQVSGHIPSLSSRRQPSRSCQAESIEDRARHLSAAHQRRTHARAFWVEGLTPVSSLICASIITQMLLVTNPVASEAEATESGGRPFNIEDFIYPHGISAPMRHARKRRFRKRAHKRVSSSFPSRARLKC